MSSSKNTLHTAPKKMGRLDEMTIFSVPIIDMILVCDFLATL